MNKIIVTTIFLFMVAASSGQDISRNDADSLVKSLAAGKTDKDRIDILFKLAQYHMFKPGENQVDLDSAKVYIEKAAVLNAKQKSVDADGFLMLLKSLLAREKGQMKEGKEMANNAVAMLKKGKDKYYLGKAYFALSDYYDYSNSNESTEKMRLVELASKTFQESGNIERQAFTLTFLADLYDLNEESSKALEKLDLALLLYKSIGHSRLQSVYILYTSVYYSEGNYKQAVNYGLMALKSAKSTGDSTMSLCQINNMIALTFDKLKEFTSAIGYYQAALQIAERHNDNNALLLLMHNIVRNYIMLKKPDEALVFMKSLPQKRLEPKSEEYYIYTPLSYLYIYNELKKYPEVQHYCNEILHLIKLHRPLNRMLNNFYIILIRFYLESRQYSSAAMYIGIIDSLNRKINDPDRNKVNYYLKFRLDTAQHHYKSAVANLLAYQTLNDSLFNETSNRQIKQLEVEYETEKNRDEIKIKDQDIKMLHQNNQLQHSNLEKAWLVRNFTIAGIIFLFIIIGLLYRQYRHKQQSNNIITHKNEQLQHFLTEKEWLVKEIHHRVKNNFHMVASLLEIQSSYLKNEDALAAIKESQNRIHSMSIIHQKLYQTEKFSTIHMPEYIYELVEFLRESYGIRENIIFTLDIESIDLNHLVAITLGLILNEAITNSIKYAFTEEAEGKISISLSHISDSQIILTISDNGRGLPVGVTKMGASMGMELLQGLAEDIRGSFSIEAKEGTHIKIIFCDASMHSSDIEFRS